MAQLSEILAKEQNRMDIVSRNVAYFYREGSFLRAYEWSAWLYVKYYSDLKVTTRYVKSLGQVMAFVGFPGTSIAKYTPDGAQVITEADGSVRIILPFEVKPEELQGVIGDYDFWKQGLAIEERPQKAAERRGEVAQRPVMSAERPQIGVFGILQNIMSYSVENSTPSDNLQFIYLLKQQVSSLL